MVLSRREFLKTGSSTALALSLGSLLPACSPGGDQPGVASGPSSLKTSPLPTPAYGGWKDLWAEKWQWDRIAKGTHHINCWYQRGCAWNVYVKDNLVLREEQVAAYEATNADVPDYNPRGCQKGACFSHRMYDSSRLLHPLKRVGERGEGRWKRVAWQDALDDVADKLIDAMVEDGPGSLYWDFGTSVTNGGHGVAVTRTAHVTGSVMLDDNSEIGDHHPGAFVTTGKICFASSADDWFYSDLILAWGGNPVYTQIPNAHFITEARYNGAHLVSIAPDYNATSVHADQWVTVAVGSDAALGLGMARVIVEEGLYDQGFVREQTDLGLLVRRDNGRFLREADLVKGGSDERMYCWDEVSGGARALSRRSLKLEGLRPALHGEFTVNCLEGRVAVLPAFELLRESLVDYDPASVERVTGVAPAVLEALARRVASARAVTILTQSNFSKFYHGIEMERVQLLLLALCGQIGHRGAGFSAFPWLTIESPEVAGVSSGSLSLRLGAIAMGLKAAPGMAAARARGETTEMYLYERAREEYSRGGFISSVLFFHLFGGLDVNSGSSKKWETSLPRELDDYLDESIEKGWQLAPVTPPRVLMSVGGNMLRRARGYDRLVKHLLPRLDLLVSVDWRMSNTALFSDYVFPAAGWYERDDITWATPHAPFAHVTTAAVEPLGDSKPDWVFHCRLMKTMQRRAKERGITTYTDRHGKPRRLDRAWDEFSFHGRYTDENPEDFLTDLLKVNTNLGGISWEKLKEDGFARFTSLGMSPVNIGNATDIEPHETINPNTWYTRDKKPWPTYTRRMQFYVDHERYLELGEQLPVHIDNPPIGGDYPLALTGGHARWSIHASWRDNALMLRLQRGEPVVIIGPIDARNRGIADGDRVLLRNDTGRVYMKAKVTPSLRPGQVTVYHAWEPYQFEKGSSHQSLFASPINPLQLAGGYYHLRPWMIQGEPGQCDRGTRVEIEKAPA